MAKAQIPPPFHRRQVTHAPNVKEADLWEVGIHTPLLVQIPPNHDGQLVVLEDPVLSNRLALTNSFEVMNLH